MDHRVRVLVCGAVALAAMVVSTSASADRPIKDPAPGPPATSFPAGTVCQFPVTLETTTSRTFTITHLDKSGDLQWVWGGGTNVLQVTNELTGEAITVNA